MRTEPVIFEELTQLTSSPGYIHALAYFCFYGNMTFYSGTINPEDAQHLYSGNRLIRTEISTLLGLLVKGTIIFEQPTPNVMQGYLDQTLALMEELHGTFSESFFDSLRPEDIAQNPLEVFSKGSVLREPIFYGGESAYSFQYRDLAPKKYARDDNWLLDNKGFSIGQARDVVRAVGRVLDAKVTNTVREMRSKSPEQWTFLPAFSFSVHEVAAYADIHHSVVGLVLQAFAAPPGECNERFTAINDYNLVNATPLIPQGNDQFILLHIYSLVEALYESPFFWMTADKLYSSTSLKHRGMFTEEFATERLTSVFGDRAVYPNVDIFDSKGNKHGEIDVLVVFGNRAVVLQAKSKRLTIEARKGNDLQIRDDFKKSIQDSCDQAFKCARVLNDETFSLKNPKGQLVELPFELKQVYTMCLVSDHYPALSVQARQFLKFDTTDFLSSPFVLDVFTLDSMTEMLNTPLRLLSYIDRRTHYADRFMATHESVILSYHLKNNLWQDESTDVVMLSDDVANDLDTAMTVRREGIPGNRTPDGILTRFDTTLVGRLVKDIELQPNPATIDLGFLLLSLSEDAVIDASNGINRILRLELNDGRGHDLTVAINSGSSGFTFHCNTKPDNLAIPQLESHCLGRKYIHHAQSWFGICIQPSFRMLRFVLSFDFVWEFNPEAENMARSTVEKIASKQVVKPSHPKPVKVGRNDPCPCGSGKKFKKCCLIG